MRSHWVLCAAGLLCAGSFAATKTDKPQTLHGLMKNVVAVQAQVIWDVGNHAQDEQGNPDASKITAADWNKLISASSQIRRAAQTLAQAPSVLVASRGQKIDDEGTSPDALGAAQVQAIINSNKPLFNAFASALSTSMDQFAEAAKAKDATKVFDLSGQLDEVCESCHAKFWYPNEHKAR